MALEQGTYIEDLIPTNPLGTDPKSQGDDHLRLIKYVLKQSFPTINAPLTAELVPFVPVGSLSATNVQDAIEEVGAAVGTVINAVDVVFAPIGTINATNVQAAIQEISKASEISVVPFNNVTSTNVQSALEELGYANKVAFTPTGTIGATNVQAAIVELSDSKEIKYTPTGTIAAGNVQDAITELATETNTNLNNRVLKAGDTMTGILNMTGGGVHFGVKDATQSHSTEYTAPSSAPSSLYAERVSSVTYLTLNVANNSAEFSHAHNGIAYAPVSWNDQSDISLKSNLAQITGALDKLSLIHGYTYNRNDYPGNYAGVVAQEVQSVLPQAISDHNGTLSVSPMAVVALLVQAVKELKVQLDALSNP